MFLDAVNAAVVAHALAWRWSEPGCTGFAAGGYGTGMEGAAAGIAVIGAHGFPAVLTSLVGRAGAVREVAGLLEEYRLVTVTGPGGVGKTRLAGAIARQVAARFADGVWLAGLAPVRDPVGVAPTVAVALGVREQPGMPAADALMRVLGRRQLLVVLDNCEHVIGEAAQLCAGLLAACDDVRVLATSRERMRIAGEAAYRLAPLPVPGPGDDSAGAEAVTLFADRARAADAGFALTGENRADVVRLVRRLDGMPLAIELAAARVEALGVSQLLDRLDDQVALLAGGTGWRRAAPVAGGRREWSYQLLDKDDSGCSGRCRCSRRRSPWRGPRRSRKGAAPAVLRLVECSLLVPPRPGSMAGPGTGCWTRCETTGPGCWPGPEQDQAAGGAGPLRTEGGRGSRGGAADHDRRAPAARRLDAEDATAGQVLAWAVAHDPDTRCAAGGRARLVVVSCAGGCPGQDRLLSEVAGRAERGSDGWCAVQCWLGRAALAAPGPAPCTRPTLPPAKIPLQRDAHRDPVGRQIRGPGDRVPGPGGLPGPLQSVSNLRPHHLGPAPEAAGKCRPPRPGPWPARWNYPASQPKRRQCQRAKPPLPNTPPAAPRRARQPAPGPAGRALARMAPRRDPIRRPRACQIFCVRLGSRCPFVTYFG